MNVKMKPSSNIAAACFVLALAGLSGCSDSGAVIGLSSPNGLTPGGATVVYGVQTSSSGTNILQFPLASSSSNLSPAANLVAPSGTTFMSVATDSSGTLYVGAYLTTGQGEVLVYPAGSTGAATPTRTILGDVSTTTTTFTAPQSMHISSTGTLAILSAGGLGYSIATLPATSSGTVTPTTLIQGSSTQLDAADCVTIDQNGTVYVTNYVPPVTNGGPVSGSVLEFASGATGNIAPTTVINTGTTEPYGIAADASGNVFAVLDDYYQVNAGSIVVYAAGASGLATPTRTITGTATDIFYGGGLRLDSVGNLYMVDIDSSSDIRLLGFAQSAVGNVLPGLNIASTAYNAPTAEIAVR